MTVINAPRDNLVRANLETEAAAIEGRTMTGYPIVFNKWTKINSWEGTFKERIAPGAVNNTLRVARDQIKVLFNHGMDPAIGDKPLGKPTVMEADDRGLYVEVPLSDTTYNNDLLALMRDGALDGQSFRFSVLDETWDKQDSKMPERTITQMNLYEFGPVTFPAYQQTTIGLRSAGNGELTFAADAWNRLDEEQRDNVAQMLGTDLRTLRREAAVGTSRDGAAQHHNDSDEHRGTQSGVPEFIRRRVRAETAVLRSLTNARSD